MPEAEEFGAIVLEFRDAGQPIATEIRLAGLGSASSGSFPQTERLTDSHSDGIMLANGKSIRGGFVQVLRDGKRRWIGPVAETAQAAREDCGDQAKAVFGEERTVES